MKNKPDIAGMYQAHIQQKNQENSEERYVGKESHFHASGTGTCARKHWYRSNNIQESDPTDLVSSRVMRLGTLVHSDYEEALKSQKSNLQLNRHNSTINSSIYSSNIEQIITEGEINLPEYNVRGFFDAVFIMVTGEVYLYDFKTIRSYPYSLKFGHKKKENYATGKVNELHELQLATYGIAIEKTYGRLDGMFLYYYNKDNSMVKEKPVDMEYIDKAKEYWIGLNEIATSSVSPRVEKGVSPVYSWECKYCNFVTYCQDN